MTSPFRIPPLLLPLCLFITGIAAAGNVSLFLPEQLALLALCITLPFLFIRPPIHFTIPLCLVLFCAGNLHMQPLLQKDPETTRFLADNETRVLQVTGVITSRPEARESGYRLVIKPEDITETATPYRQIKPHGLLLLRIGSGGETFASGDRIRFEGKLTVPRNFGTPGEFDSERFYRLKQILATTYVKNAAGILFIGQADEFGLQRHFDQTAVAIGRFIMSRVPGPEGGIIKALLIGDAADIPQQLKDLYSRTGVNHILSISGFHIGIIALALIQVCYAVARLFPALLLYCNFRRFALMASIPLIIYYLFLSGGAPATARSVIMLCLLAAGLCIERETDPVNSLALAACALLLFNPAYLYTVSFQLSFLALWGLIVITPLLIPVSKETSGWGYRLVLFAAASTAAVTVTLLPVAYYFQQASLTGIISNFFIVPLLGYGAVVSGFAAIPFIWLFPTLAGYMFTFTAALTSAANRLIVQLAAIPTLPAFIPTKTDMTLFLFALLAITVIRSRPFRSATLAIVPLFLILLHQLPQPDSDFSLRIDFLSVGQGESTLIRFADGRSMLIDGGGTFRESGWDVGKLLLLPALRKMGVDRVDYLVLSHAHPDHLQGVKSVAENLPVGEFWESGLNNGEEYRQLREILALRSTPVKVLTSNSPPIMIAGTKVRCLYPLYRQEPMRDMNDTSLILRLDSGSFSALFCGDIGFDAESLLLEKRSPLRATLLKVPHHGSRYSTGPDFLDAVTPEIALISAGYNNSFGLPAPETVEQLSAKNISTYRTDRDGTISIKLTRSGEKPIITAAKRQIR